MFDNFYVSIAIRPPAWEANGLSLHSLGAVGGISSVFGFENHAWGVDFNRMPCSGWYLAAIATLSRVKADTFYLIATVIEDNLVEASAEAHYALGGTRVTMYRHFRPGHQGIQYPLRVVIGRCAQIMRRTKSRRLLRLTQQSHQKLIVKYHCEGILGY